MSDTNFRENENSFFILILFVGSFFFQITLIKHIWQIESISRIFNTLFLAITLLFSLYSLFTLKTKKDIWIFYILPGWLIIIGIITNFLINYYINDEVSVGHLAPAMPWLLFLTIHTLIEKKNINHKKLWKYSYYIMLVRVMLGLFDYFFFFFSGYSAKIIETQYGIFLAGRFSILHMLEDGSPHFRFYASFAEPGTLGMMILPYITYSFLYKKYIGMSILMVGLYFTFSLGANISLLFLIALLTFLGPMKKSYFVILFNLLLVIILIITVYPSLKNEFDIKGDSKTVRLDNISDGMSNILEIFTTSSFGLKLEDSTAGAEKNSLYSGSNFIPLNYLNIGGILAFVGYCVIIYFSFHDSIRIILKRKELIIEDYIVATSLIIMLPFLIQRTTLWETSLFALLYFPSLLKSRLT